MTMFLTNPAERRRFILQIIVILMAHDGCLSPKRYYHGTCLRTRFWFIVCAGKRVGFYFLWAKHHRLAVFSRLCTIIRKTAITITTIIKNNDRRVIRARKLHHFKRSNHDWGNMTRRLWAFNGFLSTSTALKRIFLLNFTWVSTFDSKNFFFIIQLSKIQGTKF